MRRVWAGWAELTAAMLLLAGRRAKDRSEVRCAGSRVEKALAADRGRPRARRDARSGTRSPWNESRAGKRGNGASVALLPRTRADIDFGGKLRQRGASADAVGDDGRAVRRRIERAGRRAYERFGIAGSGTATRLSLALVEISWVM